MTLEEVKSCLYQMIEKYFATGTVIWAEHGNTVPPLPYMTLKISSAGRAAFPIEEEETRDRQRAYQCSSILEANLYTKGSPVTEAENTTVGYVNTALSGMARFSNYLESEYITDILAEKGIAISLMPPVRDLSFLENESAYRYRAMAEYTVSFAMEADGAYGISCLEIQADGGNGEGAQDFGNNSGQSGVGNNGNAGTSGSGNDGNTGTSGLESSGNTEGSGSGSGTSTTVPNPDFTGLWKEPDFSNGGTKEMADTLIGTIEEVEMTGEYEE